MTTELAKFVRSGQRRRSLLPMLQTAYTETVMNLLGVKRNLTKSLVVVAWIAIWLAGLHLVRAYSFAPLTPPPGVDTLAEFERLMPPPTRLYQSERDGKSYIVWIGEHSRPPIVASGPACYVFDLEGILVEWRDETDGGHSIDYFYHQRRTATDISVTGAHDLVKRHKMALP